MFLESIKFYEHVEVLLKISDVITNVFEALRGNPALDHDNITTYTNVTYHEYQSMFDIALFKKKLSKVAQ